MTALAGPLETWRGPKGRYLLHLQRETLETLQLQASAQPSMACCFSNFLLIFWQITPYAS